MTDVSSSVSQVPSGSTGQQVNVVQPQPSYVPTLETVGQWALAVIAIATLITLIYNFMMKDIKRDVRDTDHKLKNQISRIDALELSREREIERTIKLETTVHGIEKSQDRVERAVEALTKTVEDKIDKVVALVTNRKA